MSTAAVAERPALIVKRLGRVGYEDALEAMRRFTAERGPGTADEIWLLEHPPVYTLGQAGKTEHLLHDGAGIPVVHTDRGGQITYHGPGQLIAYLLIDLARRGLKVRQLVAIMEQTLIDTLTDYGIQAERLAGAPGVYVDGAKIAALGLRVRRGCSYHGLSLNIDMDLSPFSWINPCGYAGMPTTQLARFGVQETPEEIGARLLRHLQALLPQPI